MRMTVLLPAPLGPRNPKISPWSTWRSTPSTAFTSPKWRTRPSATIGARQFCSLFSMGFLARGRDRLPHALRRARHVDVSHPEVTEGVDDGGLHGGCGTDGAALADAFGAQRVDEGRSLHVHHLDARQLGSRDERVVG